MYHKYAKMEQGKLVSDAEHRAQSTEPEPSLGAHTCHLVNSHDGGGNRGGI